MQVVESRSVSYSVALHVGVLLIAAFGLPALLPKTPDPEPMVMTVELLPISQMTNVKPNDKPIQKEMTAQAKPTPPKFVTPPPPAKAEPTPPTPTPPPPKEKTFDPDEGALPKDKVKPIEKPKEPEKPKEDPLKKILEDLKKQAEAEAKKPAAVVPEKTGTDAKTQAAVTTTSEKIYDDSAPMSISELDSIRGQISPNWRMPAGAKDASKLVVILKLKVGPDGTITDAKLAPEQTARAAGDPFFRAAADSAIAAVFKTKQLKNLPVEKMSLWSDITMSFTPPADL